MNFNELLIKLIYLTQRNNISNAEIGAAIELDRQSISGRAARNSRFKEQEIAAIEKHFGVNFTDVSLIKDSRHSFKIQNNTSIQDKASKFSTRLSQLQDETGQSDKEMSKLLDIYCYEYKELKSGIRKPELRILNLIKQHFNVSLDWLLYGE